jgi:RimJ/RimL family protein N-acetyltransferase
MFIGEEKYRGKGIGSKSLELFIENHVFTKFDYAFVDPSTDNLAAIKAYIKAGFTKFNGHNIQSITLMLKPKKLYLEKE